MKCSVFYQSGTVGRWILNRGALQSPCDDPYCKRHIERGEWYWREEGWLFCEQCAAKAGVRRAA